MTVQTSVPNTVPNTATNTKETEPRNDTLLDTSSHFDTTLIGMGPDFCYVLGLSAERYGCRWVQDMKSLDTTALNPVQMLLAVAIAATDRYADPITIDCSSQLVLLLLVTGNLSRDYLRLAKASNHYLEIPFKLPKLDSPVVLRINLDRAEQPELADPRVVPLDMTVAA